MKRWLVPTKGIVIFLLIGLASVVQGQTFTPENFTIRDGQTLNEIKETREIQTELPINLAEDNPLYSEILQYFGDHYQRIGERQLAAIENGRDLSIVGGMNHIGIRYTKPFVDFKVELQRQVAPDLFHDERWLVTDTMDLYIEASKLLSNLENAGIIDITQEQYAAFAGLTFKRTYKYVHYADTYQEGLGFNLEKLFFGFTHFRSSRFLELEAGEILSKEDSLVLAAGGVGNLPLGHGLSANAGALIKYSKLSKVVIQAVEEDEQVVAGERVRVSYEKSKAFSLGLRVGVVADFLNLLRVSLLSYDFSYSLLESYQVNLAFNDDQMDQLVEPTLVKGEVLKMLKQKTPDLDIISPYIVSEQRRKIQEKKSQFKLLLLGASREQKTSHIQIAKEGMVKTFFRHNFEKITYRQDLFSRLFSIVLKSFLQLDQSVRKRVSDTKALLMEYDHERNLIKNKDTLNYHSNDEEKLTLNFKRNYYAYKTKGFGGRLSKKKALGLLNDYSGIDRSVINAFKNDQLIGPISLDMTFLMGKKGIDYFNGLTLNQVYDRIEETCNAKSKRKWRWFRNLFNGCLHSLKRSFDKYEKTLKMKTYNKSHLDSCKRRVKKYRRGRWFSSRRKLHLIQSCLQKDRQKSLEEISREIPVWRLAQLFEKLHQKSKKTEDYHRFFGDQNVFLHGSFQAIDPNTEMDFVSHFKEGEFEGFGLVNNFMRRNSSSLERLPASK